MSERDDEDLMRAAGKGDAAAFGEIVSRHQAWAWRVAWRFTGDAAEAEDLVQDAFLKVFEAAPRYRAIASFRTYLHRVVTRRCLDWHRKKRPLLSDRIPEPTDPAPQPDAAAQLRDRERRIRSALDELPADQRLAVVLRYYEGLDASTMATAMGRTPKAVERLLARARKALRPRLQTHLG